jgi:hypothetical protein
MLALRAAAVTPLLALATALLVTAMVAYPGGSASSPDANAFVPWRDYFCDLLAERTASGRDNTLGMVCARIGMVLTAVALWPLWREGVVARPWPARQRVIRWAGALAVLAMPAVAWTPSGAWPLWHSVAILVAGVPGGLALVLTAACLWQTRRERPGTARLTVLFGIAAAAVALLWTLCFVATWPATPLANAQKIAWLLLLAWAVALARAR